MSACRANGVSGRSAESTSAGGRDEGVCVKLGENGVSAGVQSRSTGVRSSRSTESGSTCDVAGVESVEAALRPGCLKFSGCGDRGRHFATVAPQLCSKLPYNSQREIERERTRERE